MPRISRMLHAPASRRAGKSETVATYVQNFEDASCASVTTHRKQREGRHMSPLAAKISRMLHAPASRRAENNERVAAYAHASCASVTTCRKQREGRHLRPEFQGRFMRQRHNAPETVRRSPLAAKIARMLHAPVSRCAENNERVATYGQNFEDAPSASVNTRRKQREGRSEFRGHFTCQRQDAPTDRPSPF